MGPWGSLGVPGVLGGPWGPWGPPGPPRVPQRAPLGPPRAPLGGALGALGPEALRAGGLEKHGTISARSDFGRGFHAPLWAGGVRRSRF